MRQVLGYAENYFKKLSVNYYPYTNVIGLTRSLLATGLLLTLFFTPIEYIITQLTDGTLLNPLLNPVVPINKYNFFLLLGIEHIGFMKYAAMVVLILVISGYLPQLTCLLHWWVAVSFMLSSSAIDGGDQIHANLSFLLIPLCLTDPRANHWFASENPRKSPLNFVGYFSVWLIKIQMVVIYFHASVGKYGVSEWANGTSIYYWLYHSVFGMPKYLEGFTYYLLSQGFIVTALTYGVLVFEMIMAAAIFMSRKRRNYLLPLAISFHFLIILYHGIFSFFFSMLAGLIIYLGNPHNNFHFNTIKKKLGELLGSSRQYLLPELKFNK